MKPSYLFTRTTALILSIVFGLSPVSVLAASSHPNATASIDVDSLQTKSGAKASLSGTSTDVSKIGFSITASSSSKTLFKSKTLKVRNYSWHSSVSKKLKDGTYTVSVYELDDKKHTVLASSTLTVGALPAKLRVAYIPLLGGGTAHAGSAVPISYLQVSNQGTATTTIAGFWVKQNGSADASSVIGFGSVDDKGNFRTSSAAVEGVSALKNGVGYVPSGATIAPGQTKLFTLKAQLSATAARFTGQTLMLDVTGVDAAATFTTTFPITGTTWVIAQ